MTSLGPRHQHYFRPSHAQQTLSYLARLGLCVLSVLCNVGDRVGYFLMEPEG
jgi:hypothetical protein